MNSIKQTWGDKVEKANKNIENSEAIEDLNKIENIAFIDINGTKISIELLESQKYENVEAIPIKSDFFGKKDFLTLKKGYEMGKRISLLLRKDMRWALLKSRNLKIQQ